MAEQTSVKPEVKEKRVKVIATARGYDNDGMQMRETGDVFTVRASALELRPKLDAQGDPIPGAFYAPPSWFEAVVA